MGGLIGFLGILIFFGLNREHPNNKARNLVIALVLVGAASGIEGYFKGKKDQDCMKDAECMTDKVVQIFPAFKMLFVNEPKLRDEFVAKIRDKLNKGETDYATVGANIRATYINPQAAKASDENIRKLMQLENELLVSMCSNDLQIVNSYINQSKFNPMDLSKESRKIYEKYAEQLVASYQSGKRGVARKQLKQTEIEAMQLNILVKGAFKFNETELKNFDSLATNSSDVNCGLMKKYMMNMTLLDYTGLYVQLVLN